MGLSNKSCLLAALELVSPLLQPVLVISSQIGVVIIMGLILISPCTALLVNKLLQEICIGQWKAGKGNNYSISTYGSLLQGRYK